MQYTAFPSLYKQVVFPVYFYTFFLCWWPHHILPNINLSQNYRLPIIHMTRHNRPLSLLQITFSFCFTRVQKHSCKLLYHGKIKSLILYLALPFLSFLISSFSYNFPCLKQSFNTFLPEYFSNFRNFQPRISFCQ